MKTIEHETKHRQPEVHCDLVYRYIAKPEEKEKVVEDDNITKFFRWLEENLDPICDAIRQGMRRFRT